MIVPRNRLCPSGPGAVRVAMRGAMTVALLIGGGTEVVAHESDARSRIMAEVNLGNPEKAIALGEAAVIGAPGDAMLRAELGHAYLRAGRFESAARVLRDAVALGDGSDRIALVLALAQIACGDNRAALATLDRGGNIPPADLGLALALAGDSERGIAVLSDGARDGSASPVLRQNLAYAYALAGRWADARLTASFDVPPDQVDTRLQQWAETMQSGGERGRIARLLNVPMTPDRGMPEAVALAVPAQAKTAPAPGVAPLPGVTPIPEVTRMPVMAMADPSVMASPALTSSTINSPAIAALSAPITAVAPDLAPYRSAIHARAGGTTVGHFVQLGAYHSLHQAQLGKIVLAKRHPQLRGHALQITQATIHGRSYWRVVLSGFDGVTASSLCASLKRQGAACFAYTVRPTRATV